MSEKGRVAELVAVFLNWNRNRNWNWNEEGKERRNRIGCDGVCERGELGRGKMDCDLMSQHIILFICLFVHVQETK